jgi:hypothetical protein
MSVSLSVPKIMNSPTTVIPSATSYEIICAETRIEPSIPKLLLPAQPASIEP